VWIRKKFLVKNSTKVNITARKIVHQYPQTWKEIEGSQKWKESTVQKIFSFLPGATKGKEDFLMDRKTFALVPKKKYRYRLIGGLSDTGKRLPTVHSQVGLCPAGTRQNSQMVGAVGTDLPEEWHPSLSKN